METRNDLEGQQELVDEIRKLAKELNRLATRAGAEYDLRVRVGEPGMSLSGGEYYPFDLEIKKVIYY